MTRAAGVEVAVLDRSGTIIGVNEAWADFCTANGGDLSGCGAGTSYLDACDAAADTTSRQVAAALRAMLSGEQLTAVTFTIPCDGPDGERWYDLCVVPRFGDATENIGATVMLWRVARPPAGLATSRRLAVTAPEPGAEWDLIEAFPDGTVLVDESGSITYVNRQLEELSGFDRTDLLGHPIELLVPETFRAHHRAWTRGYRAAPRARAMGAGVQLALRRADGHELPVEISLAPVTIGAEAMTMASVRNVSAQRAGDRSRRRLLHVLDLTPDAVLVVDVASATIEHVNAGASSLLGWTRSELAAMDFTVVAPGSDVRGQVEAQPPGTVHRSEVVRRARDGTAIACDSRSQVVTTPDGLLKLVVVDRDARERRAAEATRRKHADRSALVARITTMVLSDVASETVWDEVVTGTRALLGEPAPTPAPAPSDPALSPASTQIRERAARALELAVATSGLPLASDDPEILGDLARQLALVMELGTARSDRQRLTMLEDRQRIARDLHDTVIQALIGIGLQLGPAVGQRAGSDLEAHLDSVVEQLDAAIAHLRLVVFDTREGRAGEPVVETLRHTLTGASRTLGHDPVLVVTGDPELLAPEVVNHLVPVLREALSNIARHAAATHTTVSLTVGADLVELLVEDDGVGPGGAVPGGGSTSFRERSAMLGGTASLLARAGGGAVLRWTARVDPRPAHGPASS